MPTQPIPIFPDEPKIRAASQRSKIRDLHDLSEISARPLDQNLVRALAVLKLWNSGGPGLDYERFRSRITDGAEYDLTDLANLLRKDQRPDLDIMIRRVVDGFRFLSDLTQDEHTLATDNSQRNRDVAGAHITSMRQDASKKA